MKTEAYKHYIEILPAALLSQRGTWQQAARSLPVGACLLITNPKDKEQTELMRALVHPFHEKGKRVFIWKSSKG